MLDLVTLVRLNGANDVSHAAMPAWEPASGEATVRTKLLDAAPAVVVIRPNHPRVTRPPSRITHDL